MPSSPLLIVGLGNPGAEYATTRHNLGFIALDLIARHYGCAPWKNKFRGLVTTGVVGEGKSEFDVMLLKPETFMNLSGEAVFEAARFYKTVPENVIVFHDEIDVPAGEIRTKQGGGHAGHNGLKSIDQHLGVNYYRVRIGVGHPGQKDMVSGHVLGRISDADADLIMPQLGAFINDLPAYLGKL